MGLVIQIGIPMLIVLVLTQIDRKKNGHIEPKQFQSLSRGKKFLAAVLGLAMTFLLIFAHLCLAGFLQNSAKFLSSNVVSFINGSAQFSLFYCLAGLMGAITTVFCFEVLDTFKVTKDRIKQVLIAISVLPIISILMGLVNLLNKTDGYNLMVAVFFVLLPQLALFAAGAFTSLAFMKFEQGLNPES